MVGVELGENHRDFFLARGRALKKAVEEEEAQLKSTIEASLNSGDFSEHEVLQGLAKLRSMVNAEIDFFLKRDCQALGLSSTNLYFLEGLFSTFKAEKNVKSLRRKFAVKPNKHENASETTGKRTVTVDVVSDFGLKWTKVSARNPRSMLLFANKGREALSDLAKEWAEEAAAWALEKEGEEEKEEAEGESESEGGESDDDSDDEEDEDSSSVLHQAKLLLKAARAHPAHFRSPTVVFRFVCGLAAEIKETLEEMGVLVEGCVLSEEELAEFGSGGECLGGADDSSSSSSTVVGEGSNEKKEKEKGESESLSIGLGIGRRLPPPPESIRITTEFPVTDNLSVDVTSLIAAVSDFLHDSNLLDPLVPLRQEAFRRQREMETREALWPRMRPLLANHKLFTPRPAFEKFWFISERIAGPGEWLRCHRMFRFIDAETGQTLIPPSSTGRAPPDPESPSASAAACGAESTKEEDCNEWPYEVRVLPVKPSERSLQLEACAARERERRNGGLGSKRGEKASGTQQQSKKKGKMPAQTGSGGRLLTAHIEIFGTADRLEMTTLSSNSAAVRSAASLGVRWSVLLFPERSLLEQHVMKLDDGSAPSFPERKPTPSQKDGARTGPGGESATATGMSTSLSKGSPPRIFS
uniref:DUF5614 domain-containing protein n=1 Tax=Chromera velia CCMP2878 TaxID=1169474 RepID=A0A0G4F4B7_9ALVE|eukprot:Cvel_15032.t1-p1 / transcript=Cvel_15032.t1 / gene=Cvel_15032 / organism=Chromera_velia_CCMP2878 / gene_product=hypothetical protein / transcript_product=hypothetical protein / location=Cvel_scaffold1094:5197-7904(-) / protein_length=640 / sequence_SO=supercontig / SO=protein_coding / is_pseudo=false